MAPRRPSHFAGHLRWGWHPLGATFGGQSLQATALGRQVRNWANSNWHAWFMMERKGGLPLDFSVGYFANWWFVVVFSPESGCMWWCFHAQWSVCQVVSLKSQHIDGLFWTILTPCGQICFDEFYCFLNISQKFVEPQKAYPLVISHSSQKWPHL